MSDDLISRQALIKDMRSRKYIDGALCEIFETVVDEAPSAYDVDKVVRELEEYQKMLCIGELKIFYGIIEKCIEIVRSGGIEKDSGLI